MDETRLRDVVAGDLPVFFEHQRDPEANRTAAFPARDWDAFTSHWAKILGDVTVTIKTILVDGEVAGHIVSWKSDRKRIIGYWIG
ncbi:MAG: GNAT family N-acetyltransferase, partial [Planctomycetia bacterium]